MPRWRFFSSKCVKTINWWIPFPHGTRQWHLNQSTSHLVRKPIGMCRFTLTITVSKLTEWMRSLWIIRERKSGQLKWVVRCWRIPERRMRRRQSSTVLSDGSWGSNTQGITSTSVILSLMCYIGRWSKELELTMKMLVGVRVKGVLQKMKKATCLVLTQYNTYFRGNCCLTV